MAKFDSLDEPFSLDGNWWIPAEPNLGQQIGTLTFELGKYITLTLDSILGLSDSQKIIQGKTRTGHHVLLLENDGRLNEFYPSLVLISEQEIPWNISKEINLLHLTARYTYLEDWVAVNPFQHDTEQNEETRITKASLRYTRPEEIVVPLDSLNAQIRFIPGIQQSLQKTKAEIIYNIRV
ncbi:MAG: hypothetical protein HY866_15525 [Chloroflexi bacterium]|nr:hypothetical protein [Chloroflexota bacterium]